MEVSIGTASNTAKIQRYLRFKVILELLLTETVRHPKSRTDESTVCPQHVYPFEGYRVP
jgi:hypothetical protein